MSPIQVIATVAVPPADRGALVVGAGVIFLVVLVVVAAGVWGAFRMRSVQPVLRKGVSSIREERFASEVMREFILEAQHHPVPARNLGPESTADPAATPGVATVLADEVAGGGAGALDGFYANMLTSKPVKAGGPATVTLTSGTLTSGGSRPELSGAFRESVQEFVAGIRNLANAVERAALVGEGSELDRAARSVEAFNSGLGALPIKDLLISASRAAEAGLPGRDSPQERPT